MAILGSLWELNEGQMEMSRTKMLKFVISRLFEYVILGVCNGCKAVYSKRWDPSKRVLPEWLVQMSC